MGQFGESLRKERVSRGIALETISNSTKIVTRYLTALENERFDALPGGILSKGIVRGYARVVGLDETVWVDRFLTASQEQGMAPQDDGWIEFASNVGRTRARIHARSEVRRRWAGVAVLLLLLTGLGWFVWHFVSVRVEAQVIQSPAVTAAAVAAPPASTSQ